MRILVAGANGQVGHALLRALASGAAPSTFLAAQGGHPTHPLPQAGDRAATRGDACGRSTGHPLRSDALPKREGDVVIPATRNGTLADGAACERIDLADPAGLSAALDRIAPDLVINAAAYTAVDRAEDESDLAQRINGDAVGVLGAWAARHAARVVHYSTDYVFDGASTRPYREDDATHPLGAYGRSKRAGETALRDSGARHLLFRTAWVYAARGHNFLKTMLRLGAERDELRVVDDQVGAPTSARLIAEVTVAAIARWHTGDAGASERLDGTYHLVAAGQTSWCGFARAIFERARAARLLARVPAVAAIATADYPTRAVRPMFSVLDTARLRATFEVALPDWQATLGGVIDELAATAH